MAKAEKACPCQKKFIRSAWVAEGYVNAAFCHYVIYWVEKKDLKALNELNRFSAFETR